MDYKEMFDQMKELTSKYVLVKGICDMVNNEYGSLSFKEFDGNTVYETSCNVDEELLTDSFINDEGFKDIECEGMYTFEALLTYDPAQVGNYPPPNVEVPAYYCIEHIEFKLMATKEDLDKEVDVVIDDFIDPFEI